MKQNNLKNYSIRFLVKFGEIKFVELVKNKRTILSVNVPNGKVTEFNGSTSIQDSGVCNAILRGIKERTKYDKDKGIVEFYDGNNWSTVYELDEFNGDKANTESIMTSYDNYRRKGLRHYELISRRKHKANN